MRKSLYILIVTIVALGAILSPEESHAQKYPERRITRQGNDHYEQGRFAEAETKFQKALEQNDSLYEANYNLAGALYKQQRFNDAAKIYGAISQDSLRTPQERAEALYNLGNSLFSERKFEQAIEAYKSSLRLTPSDEQCKFNLAYAQKMLQQQQQQNDQNQEQQDDQQEKNNQDKSDNQDNQNDQKDNQDNEDNKDKSQDNQDNKDKSDNQQDNQNNQQKDNSDKPQDQQQNNQNQNQNGDQPQDQKPQDNPNGQQSPQQNKGQQPRMSSPEAEQLLQAIQAEEDKTRDKMDAQKVVGVGLSGKNW